MKAATLLSWDVSRRDFRLIQDIVCRAIMAFDLDASDKNDLVMDITAVHRNIMPLRLADLLDADAFNFAHDIGGIRRHLNRQTGELGGCFVPRFAVRQ